MLVQDTKHSTKASLTHGLLVVTQYSNSVPKFDDYFKQLSTADVNGSIILEQFWEYKFNCKMTGSINRCSTGLKLTENEGFFSYRPASMVIDAVYSFAHALHRLILAECPNVAPGKARECIKGHALLGYLKNVSFDGRLGKVQFDKNGDIMGKYEVRNVYFENGHFDSRRVAELDTASQTLTVDTNLIQWHPNFTNFVEGSDKIPETVCSKPCAAGYQRIQISNKCCWSCRKCRANEITNSSATECIPCEIFEWPEQRTFRKCVEIEPDYIKWTSSLAIIMSLLALIGIIICLVVMVLFYKIKSDKLIKASSIELMYLILTGSTLGLVIVFIFLAKPSELICYIQHFGFNITFTITYCPLLAKTRRIYAIFISGRTSKVPPRFIHLTAQIVICGTLTGFQIILTVVSAILETPQPTKYMPNETKPYVELGCTLPRWGLIASLGYNVCLVLACTFYAVKARKVPQNFNETRFISFNVYTTLILWLAFIPTYFTASSEFSKVLFLIVAIIVNSYVVLILLFVPKLYAVFYVSDDDLKFLQSQIGPDGFRSRTPSAASRVSSPAPSQFTSPAHPNGHLGEMGISSIA
ncbi:metabotropic glutamate receptor 3-like [Lineus longissimus]|uniref:metabotropic glutamate receptor 3-like n=1 Tax=Lineus longissimus TaxID=88925 RepID=UPI00315DD966